MIRHIVTAVAIATTALVGIVSTAQAGDWNNRGPGYGHGPRPGYHAPRPYYGGYGHYPAPQRDRSGDRVATGIAIGVGALVLGSILANEARRQRQYEGY